jgi:deazaflavin-dependent oxidoreductase (nitroreductase family)
MTGNESGYQPPDLALVGAEHIRRYQETGGEVGYLWNGVPTLLLTTTGRKSGQARTSALIYGREGGDYLIIASVGGAPKHPQWFLNLAAHPEAQVQVRAEHVPVVARTAASPDERERLWQIMAGIWPNYHVYQARTEREIPVVVLSPR